MTYVDVTLTPAATYTYVHNGQIYDQIATTLAAHGNWEYMSYVDATNSGSTYRRHVWKCKAVGTGLPSDFYVMFQTNFVTATGVFPTNTPVYLAMAEAYSGGTLSKMASTEASITPASDLTNPATWALSTYNPPTSVFFGAANSKYLGIGSTTSQTSLRLLYIVAKDVLITNWGGIVSSGATAVGYPTYVGVYDTLMGGADPMPVVLACHYSIANSGASGGATRCPTATAGVAITEAFGTINYYAPGSATQNIGTANPRGSGSPLGALGDPTNTLWAKSVNGVTTYRLYLSSLTATTTTNSAKGMVRGYFKYARGSYSVAAHSAGDTFLIDGKVHLGLGLAAYGFWDTTAV